jgi:hypothetical protein
MGGLTLGTHSEIAVWKGNGGSAWMKSSGKVILMVFPVSSDRPSTAGFMSTSRLMTRSVRAPATFPSDVTGAFATEPTMPVFPPAAAEVPETTISKINSKMPTKSVDLRLFFDIIFSLLHYGTKNTQRLL